MWATRRKKGGFRHEYFAEVTAPKIPDLLQEDKFCGKNAFHLS